MTALVFANTMLVRGRNVYSPPPKQRPVGIPNVLRTPETTTPVPPRLMRVTRALTSSLQLIDVSLWGEVTEAERSASVVGAGGSVTGGGVAEGCGGVVTRDPLPQSGNARPTTTAEVRAHRSARGDGRGRCRKANIGPILSKSGKAASSAGDEVMRGSCDALTTVIAARSLRPTECMNGHGVRVALDRKRSRAVCLDAGRARMLRVRPMIATRDLAKPRV